MTIESLLERIAIGVETLVVRGEPKAITAATSSASAATSATAAAPKKGPGRPPKAKPAEPEPTAEADDFGEDEAVDEFGEEEAEAEEAEPTHDTVREALIAFQKKPGKTNEMARQLLKKVGGVDSLTKLAPDKFKAVIAACNK